MDCCDVLGKLWWDFFQAFNTCSIIVKQENKLLLKTKRNRRSAKPRHRIAVSLRVGIVVIIKELEHVAQVRS